jgi:hypothetical protein
MVRMIIEIMGKMMTKVIMVIIVIFTTMMMKEDNHLSAPCKSN